VLVTTRKEEIEGADCYSLDLMTEAEAIELVRRKLGKEWKSSDEAAFLGFAKSLGYLPLALDLAANLVRDGVGWEELRAEFEAERRDVALGLLDSTEEDWEHLPEEKRRKHSLQACFNLSLNRLSELQRSQFAWLGVLPEDVNLTAATGKVLWDLSIVQTKRVLKALRSRSLLMDGPEMMDGERSFRVHDLMHDMARGLVEKGAVGVESLVGAHRSFLGRYRGLCVDGRWWKPPYDRERPYEFLYFYWHLTWQLEQADWANEVHDLMAASDGQGRNAWFEACEEIGEPAVFVQDVARGWGVAEALYEKDRTRSIWLQARYALITATLNTLLDNLPVEMMAAFVKGGFWSVERAWAYVEQMQDQIKIANAIQALAADLTKPLFQVAVEKARSIQNEYRRASVLSSLAQIDNAYFTEALDAARSIQDECRQASVLSSLAQIDNAYFTEALDAARSIQDKSSQADMLSSLAQIDNAYFTEALGFVRSIQNESRRTFMLGCLSKIDNLYISEALDTARLIQNEEVRINMLIYLSEIDNADFAQLLDVARTIQDKDLRAYPLGYLATIDNVYLSEALDVARSIQDEYTRVCALMRLAIIDNVYLSEALDVARSIQDEYARARALSSLAKIDKAYFTEALKAARLIKDTSRRADVLSRLAEINKAYFTEALEAAQKTGSIDSEASALVRLAWLTDTSPKGGM
jgi:hypothetical protein